MPELPSGRTTSRRPSRPSGSGPSTATQITSATGSPAATAVGRLAQFGEAFGIDPLHIHIDDSAAGQPDREGVVVADSVALQHGPAAVGHLLRQFVDGALDTAAGDAADRGAIGPDQHARPGRQRGGVPGRHHRGTGERLSLAPPSVHLRYDVPHGIHISSPTHVRG
ncbi:hypothetical protein SANTM175S_00237 [Streptomyces antimycoticus]